MPDYYMRSPGLLPWQRTPPTLHHPVRRSLAAWVGIHLLRPAWAWRTELLAVLVTYVVWRQLATVAGGPAATAVLAAVVLALWRVPALRAMTGRLLHRTHLRRHWTQACRHAELATYNDRVPRIERLTEVPAGDLLRVRIPAGSSVTRLEEETERIATFLDVMAVRVTRDRRSAKRAEVVIARRDPLADTDPIPWPLAWVPRPSLWDPIPVGLDEGGQWVSVSLAERNLLIGGEPGAGKSVALSMPLAVAALDPDVHLTLLDGKQVELAPWAGCADTFVGPDLGDAIRVLYNLREAMDARYLALLNDRKRKVVPGDGRPLHLVVCDELAYFLNTADKKLGQEFGWLMRDLVSRGRAAGVIVLAATQKPSHDIVPTYLRDLFGFRWAMRCATSQASDTILGSGWAGLGYSAASIDAADRGVGYLLHEGGRPVRMKACLLDDEALAALAARAESLRAAHHAQDQNQDHGDPDDQRAA